MTNQSEPPEDASYAQAKHAYERRKAIDQCWENLEQLAEIRAELERVCSARSNKAQAASSPETPGPFEALLELLSGRNAAELPDLSQAAAARYEALKSDLTPERETALRLLATGQGSAKAIVDVLRSAPSLLDIVPLPYTPRVQAIREIMQIAAAGSKWDGFNDQYWTIGQMVLWAITGDRWAVDLASNNSGRCGELFGQDRAKVVFDALNVPRERIRQATDELWRQCLSGHVTALVRAPDLQWRPIPKIEWLGLDILLRMENTPWVVRRGKAFTEPGCENILFPRAEAEKLRKFPTEERAESPDVPEPDQKEDCAAVEPLTAEDDRAGNKDDGIQLPHWIIPPQEPKRSRPAVLIAWITLRSVDRWKTDGIPPQLPSGLPRSFASLTQFINKTILPRIRNQIEYDLMNKLRSPGVSETSVRRALGFKP
jgi:hypothetical protein